MASVIYISSGHRYEVQHDGETYKWFGDRDSAIGCAEAILSVNGPGARTLVIDHLDEDTPINAISHTVSGGSDIRRLVEESRDNVTFEKPPEVPPPSRPAKVVRKEAGW